LDAGKKIVGMKENPSHLEVFLPLIHFFQNPKSALLILFENVAFAVWVAGGILKVDVVKVELGGGISVLRRLRWWFEGKNYG